MNCRESGKPRQHELERDLARDVENNRKGFCKYIGQEKRPRRVHPSTLASPPVSKKTELV